MIANGNYMQKEIAYCGERELEDMGYLPVRENVSEILEHLLRIASDNPHLEKEFEEYHKGVYQDNYYDSVDGFEYCVQHDIVTNDCVLYELTDKEKDKITRMRWDGDTHYYDVFESQEECDEEEKRLAKIDEEYRKQKENYLKHIT